MMEIKLKEYVCDENLARYTDSMLFSSGTDIATAVYEVGENKTSLVITLYVRGLVTVDYEGCRYKDVTQFPEELVEKIKKNPGWWEDADTVIIDNNWFEFIYDYCGYSDGVMYESDLAKETPDTLRNSFLEVAQWVVEPYQENNNQE